MACVVAIFVKVGQILTAIHTYLSAHAICNRAVTAVDIIRVKLPTRTMVVKATGLTLPKLTLPKDGNGDHLAPPHAT